MSFTSAALSADQASASAKIARSHFGNEYALGQLAQAVDSLSQAVAEIARALDRAS